jgi:hypothetical protein
MAPSPVSGFKRFWLCVTAHFFLQYLPESLRFNVQQVAEQGRVCNLNGQCEGVLGSFQVRLKIRAIRPAGG